MTKRQPLWEIEVAHWTKEGFDPDDARGFTISRWLYHGDLRPLEAALVERREIHPAVRILLADMISGGTRKFGKPPPYRLKVERLRRGPPKKPELFARGLVVAREYGHHAGNSDEEFERVAKELGINPRTARQHLTASRKAEKKHAK
jgi:hypothetical protein